MSKFKDTQRVFWRGVFIIPILMEKYIQYLDKP